MSSTEGCEDKAFLNISNLVVVDVTRCEGKSKRLTDFGLAKMLILLLLWGNLLKMFVFFPMSSSSFMSSFG